MAIKKLEFTADMFKPENLDKSKFAKPAVVPRLWKPEVKAQMVAAAEAKNKTAKVAQLSTLKFGEEEKVAKAAKKAAAKKPPSHPE